MTMPAVVWPGQLLACMLNIVATGSQSAATWPAGWTNSTHISPSNNFMALSLGYKTAAGTEDGTTVNVTTTSSVGSYYCWVVSGSDLTVSVATAYSNSATPSSTISYPSLSPSWGGYTSLFIIDFNAYFGSPSAVSSWSSGYTSNQASVNANSGYLSGSAARTAATATESPGNTTINSNASYQQTVVLGIKAAPTLPISIPMIGM